MISACCGLIFHGLEVLYFAQTLERLFLILYSRSRILKILLPKCSEKYLLVLVLGYREALITLPGTKTQLLIGMPRLSAGCAVLAR